MLKISQYKNSLVSLFIRYIVFYSLVIVVTLTALDYYTSQVYLRSFPGIEDLFSYEEQIMSDNFQSIPNFKLRGATYLVLDENNNLIYDSSGNTNFDYELDNLALIPSYIDNNYIEVLNKDETTLVISRLYEDINEIEDYVLLDKDLNRVAGTLFSDKDKFTKEELALLSGLIDNDRKVMKYEYFNDDIKFRTIVYNSPLFNMKYLNNLDLVNNLKYFVLLAVVILMMLLESYLFRRKIIKLITPINKAIDSYKNGNLEVDYNNTLVEAKNIMDSFSNLALKLNKSNEEKEKYYEDKERIVADISHDLKTPLTVIQGYAKALQEQMVPDEKKEYYLNAIYEKSVVANSILNTFFEYTKLGHRDYVLNMTKLDLVEYTKQYLIGIYNSVLSKNFDLVIELDGVVNVNIDKVLFTRVYENIVSNALKYSKGNLILFRIYQDSEFAYIIIGDNGEGFNPKIKDKIFEPFVTSNDARVTGEGTGLGLSIVKKIINLHGASIRIIEDKEFKSCYEIKMKLVD